MTLSLTDTHIRLSQAAPHDFDTIKTLLEGCGLYTSSVTPEGSTYWLATLDGVPAGCIGLEVGEGASLIRSMAVLPRFRGRGLGRALALSALTQATLRGDREVYLFSSGAGDYWQRFGFVPSSPAEVTAALPDAPQVQSGLQNGWIHEEQVWKKALQEAK